jgi:hypothetical protein
MLFIRQAFVRRHHAYPRRGYVLVVFLCAALTHFGHQQTTTARTASALVQP